MVRFLADTTYIFKNNNLTFAHFSITYQIDEQAEIFINKERFQLTLLSGFLLKAEDRKLAAFEVEATIGIKEVLALTSLF
ncbi:MAG: hypothetical protein WKG06_19565 [Segetibacter sp.]